MKPPTLRLRADDSFFDAPSRCGENPKCDFAIFVRRVVDVETEDELAERISKRGVPRLHDQSGGTGDIEVRAAVTGLHRQSTVEG